MPETCAFYTMVLGYFDFAHLYHGLAAGPIFVIRVKSNTKFKRHYSHPVEMNKGVQCDQIIVMTGLNSSVSYPKHYIVHFHDSEAEIILIF